MGFLRHELGLSRKDAWKVWVKEAGLGDQLKSKENLKLAGESPKQGPKSKVQSPKSNGGTPGAEAGAPTDHLGGAAQGETRSEEPTGSPGAAPSSLEVQSPKSKVQSAEGEEEEAAGRYEEAAQSTPALERLRAFYDRLTLLERHRARFWEKRGLTAKTCEEQGYRSNTEANKPLLLSMPEDTPLPVLLATRLWLPGLNGEPPKPNPQFHGMALKPMRDERGRKVRDAQGKPKLECDWTVEPDLIPYWDWREPDRLLALRPHKGMMRGETPRFYVVRRRFEEGTVRLATIHEGEFKAAAMDQTMNFKQQTGLVAASAIPGITMWKPLLPEIEEWLQSLGNPMVLVSFDSENKEDPRLPGYQPDVWRRHDAEIQARLLALKLAKKGHKLVRVAPPDRAWRNARGKADWDGVLAGEVQSLKSKV